MLRLLRNTIVLWLVMVAILSPILLPNRPSFVPSELQMLRLSLCGNQLCFMGIIPGVSTWKDVSPVLRNFDLEEQDSVAFVKLENATVMIEHFEGIVTSVEVYSINNGENIGVSLRSIIQMAGSPCAIYFLTARHPRIFYPSMWVDIVLDTNRSAEGAFADSILMTPTDEILRCTSTPDIPLLKWKGFALLDRYISLYR
jgi:hypothetical protein